MLGRNGYEWDHNLWARVDAFLDKAGGGRGDGANLHERQIAKDDGQAHAAQAEHRVGLDHAVDTAQTGTQGGEFFLAGAGGFLLGDGHLELARIVQELMKRRIE